MASAFSDSLMASGGVETTPEILKTSIGMTMKIIPHVGTHMEAENKKITYLAWSVNYRPKSR